MARLHTLTYNETTYNINDVKTTNDIFINGQESGWYIVYDLERIDEDTVGAKGIKLKHRNDEDTTTVYLYLNTTTLQFHNVVEIIQTIRNY